MLIFGLITLILLLLAIIGITGYFLIKFARIIFSIEDQLENALEALNGVDDSLEDLLKMKLFFDSKEVKRAVDEALAGVKYSKMAVNALINDFTRLSKEKYIIVRSDEKEDFEEQGRVDAREQQIERINQLEG